MISKIRLQVCLKKGNKQIIKGLKMFITSKKIKDFFQI